MCCLVAFVLQIQVEAKLDEDIASVPWWRLPRGLRASSKQVFSSYAADAYPFEKTEPAKQAKTGTEYVLSITCIPASRNQHPDDASGVITAPRRTHAAAAGIALMTSHLART